MPIFHLQDFAMAYEDHGQGDPIVLIHGLGSSARDWEPQATALAERYRVIACDLRGHGQSGKPPGPYRMALLASDVAALIAHLALGKVHVIGISLGGMIAFQLALDHSACVRDVVIINSAPAVVPRTVTERFLVLQRRMALRYLSMDAVGQMVGKRLFPHAHQATLRETFRSRCAENDKAAYRATLDAILGWSVRERLHELTQRALVISGDRDYTPVSLKEEYVARMRDAELLVIADSGHATPIDQPAACNRALLAFLDGTRLSTHKAQRDSPEHRC